MMVSFIDQQNILTEVLKMKPTQKFPIFIFIILTFLLIFPFGMSLERYKGTAAQDNNITAGVVGSLGSAYQVFAPTAHQAIVNVTFGGIGIDEGVDVVECNDGGIAIAGYTKSYGIGDSDFWLIRTDANGNHLWDRIYGGVDNEECWELIECSDGGFALIGNIYNYTSADMDIWIVRTNSTGHMQWNQTYGGTANDYGGSIIELNSGNFAIIGTTRSYGPGSEAGWLINIDSNGQPLWNQTYGGGIAESLRSIVECSDGGFAMSGHTLSYGAGDYDVWLVRTDSSGNAYWNQTYGGSDYDQSSELILSTSGGFAIIGFSESFSGGGCDVWLIRTNAGGDLVWNRTYPSPAWDAGRSLIEVSTHGFAIAGSKDDSASDGWLVRVDVDGNPLWNKTYTYGPQGSEQFASIVESSSGGFITTGYVEVGIGNMDVWLLRIPEDVPPSWVESPSNQEIVYGSLLHYDLNATDASGIDTWWIDNPMNFVIDAEGIITSTGVLAVGFYELIVSVNDTFGNVLEGAFSVTVQPSGTPPIPGYLIEAIVLGLVLVTISVIGYRRRKTRK
jgi:hypothetical protein